VLDASVAAKWFLPSAEEPISEQALQLFDRFSRGEVQLLVPDLFWPEFGNILWKAARLGRISRASAAQAISGLTQHYLITEPSRSLISDALRIAVEFDRTLYDSVYVALATITNAPLITADERLFKALGTRFPVRWLKSL
jgi:predicted nucleic acid-binding protein